jgi:pectin methylesterase-like acyl-CoA thioesterase
MKQEKTNGGTRHPFATGKRSFIVCAVTLLVLGAGCKKDIQPAGEMEVQSMAKKAKAPVIVVQSGSSIQTAVDMATPGMEIKIKSGTYSESIEVNKPNLTLTGEGHVVIQNPGDADKASRCVTMVTALLCKT